jgi:hypothetical protein
LTTDELRFAIRAAWTVPAVAASLRLLGYERTRRWVGGRDRPAVEGGQADAVVRSAVRAVAVVVRRRPLRAKCLPRSLALWSLLRRRGVDAEVVIGVRPGGVPLDAHAWVERDGVALNETPEIVARFARLDRGTMT